MIEIGWPLGLKLSQTTEYKVIWALFAICMILMSGFFLWLAQKHIPMGTAYAVWTGIGAVGTFVLGILIFKDPASVVRIGSAGLIVLGVIGLKLGQ